MYNYQTIIEVENQALRNRLGKDKEIARKVVDLLADFKGYLNRPLKDQILKELDRIVTGGY